MNKLNQIQKGKEMCESCGGEDLKYYGHEVICADCGEDEMCGECWGEGRDG